MKSPKHPALIPLKPERDWIQYLSDMQLPRPAKSHPT